LLIVDQRRGVAGRNR